VIRVLVADPRPEVARLVDGLRAEGDLEVVAVAPDVETAVDAAVGVDAVLLDLALCRADGSPIAATVVTRVLTGPAGARVVILTDDDSDPQLVACIDAGAAGYMFSHNAPVHVATGIRAAVRGELVMAPVVTGAIPVRPADGRDRGPVELSRREYEVLSGVARGLKNREIGAEIFLSEPSVKGHLRHVCGKLGVSTRKAAVAEARRRGVVVR